MLADLGRRGLDAALEATIVASFTKLGPAVRRPLWGWEPVGDHALAGKVVAVTGGTGTGSLYIGASSSPTSSSSPARRS